LAERRYRRPRPLLEIGHAGGRDAALLPLHADRRKFAAPRSKFVLDGKLPIGACHHQKMIIVDDALAFCGGGDIGPDRWDTPEHLDDDPAAREDPARQQAVSTAATR
jgi:phosphatidylserine/phosphatidylglycerophosphate/cardiolipin synthase-like enzyme